MKPKPDLLQTAFRLWRSGACTRESYRSNVRKWLRAVRWMDEHGMRALSGGNGCPVSTQERRGAA